MEIYPAKYTDKRGEFETTIRNDWKVLRMNVRGIEFSGSSFDSLYPEKDSSITELETFTFAQECLCDCKISYEMPIKIITEDRVAIGNLTVQIELGKANEKGWTEQDDIGLSLSYDGKIFRSNGKSQWFENELLDIQRQLPKNHNLKCCFGCDFSDYSIYGHSFFGTMLCYKNIKEEYRKVSDKCEFMKIMHKSIEDVQETYLCPEFEIRTPGRGYRG